MENSKKQLKSLSIIVLILAGLTAIGIAYELIFGEINNTAIPEGSPENILLIAKIVIASISFIMLLPQIYIGIKGIKIAKKPDASGAHIIWGTILFVLTLISLISPAIAIVKQEDVLQNIADMLSIGVDASILFGYIKCAKKIKSEIK